MRFYLNFSEWLLNEAGRNLSWFRKQSKARRDELEQMYKKHSERSAKFLNWLNQQGISQEDFFLLTYPERETYFKQFVNTME